VSLPPDPDEPTRRLPPTEPAQPIREREVVTSHELEPAWVQEVLDRLRSLRTAVALLGVVAVAALALALWALLMQEEEGDARLTRPSTVSVTGRNASGSAWGPSRTRPAVRARARSKICSRL
jgi:hypothetical protein